MQPMTTSPKPSTQRARAHTLWMALLLALIGLAAAMTPTESYACGGFFCSQSNPVDQSGEQILFAVDGTDVTAYVQIQYQGSAQDFSWVLPLPTTPTFALGTDAVFTALRQQTDPRFEIEWTEDDNCKIFDQCGCMRWADSDFDSAPTAGGVPEENGVNVLAEGSVGPFNYQVIQASADASGDAVFSWLNANGYDQPPAAQGLINGYAQDRYVFVTLKLQQDKSAGEIQPIVLRYNDPTLACIPLRLTSIAARPDMPIRAWVLSRARAIPMNYFHVVLNANAYDWFNCANPIGDSFCGGGFGGGSTDCQQAYMDLVTRATDVVNGLGFVTEFAGDSQVMDDIIYSDGRFDTSRLRTITNAADFMQELLNQGFPSTDLVRGLLRKYIPKPDDALLPPDCQGDQSFYAVWNIANCLQHMPQGWTFDPVAFADDLQANVVQPLIDGQALFSELPYLTRLFTTMSADEMVRDPLFSFNPDLPDISNIHRVEAKPLCDAGSTNQASRVQLTYEDGLRSFIPGTFDQNTCAFQPNNPSTTANALAMIQVLDESGSPLVVDHTDIEALALADSQIAGRKPSAGQSQIDQNPNGAINNTGPFSLPRGNGTDDSGCTCQQLHSSSPNRLPLSAALALSLGLGAVLLRRRSR
jgi:hypothetical protein